MKLWHGNPTIEDIYKWNPATILNTLGIEITEIGDNYVCGKMPVDHRTIQPAGILHGGASVVLAETLGSVASRLMLNPETHYAVGMEVNANHLKPVRKGFVFGKCTPIHLGRTTHIWSIEIRNELEKLSCISRLTMSILKR